MSRQLLILRHAKSAWNTGSPSDFERPLAKRGMEDALRIGRWMKKACSPYPEWIVSSPAFRAKQTISLVAEELDIPGRQLYWEDHIYMADVPTLLKVLSKCPSRVHTALLVGHNPGLEKLLAFLCGEKLPKPLNGKQFPTACLAHLVLPDVWGCLKPQTAHVVSLIRVQDIK